MMESTQTRSPGRQVTTINSLAPDIFKEIVIALGSSDAVRIQAVSKGYKHTMDRLFCRPTAGEGPARPHGAHFWGCQEQRTRCSPFIHLDDVPAFAAAFQAPAAPPPAPAAPAQGQNQQQQDPQNAPNPQNAQNPPANGIVQLLAAQQQLLAAQQQLLAAQGLGGGGAAAGHGAAHAGGQQAQQQAQQQQRQEDEAYEATRPRLKLFEAAALLGGWWGPAAPAANAPGGVDAARQVVLAVLRECLGGEVADLVQALTSSPACPTAARGFWGCLFLGLLASTTAAAAPGGAAQLVRELLTIGQPGAAIPEHLVPVLAPDTESHSSHSMSMRLGSSQLSPAAVGSSSPAAAAEGRATCQGGIQAAGCQAGGTISREWLQPGPRRYVRYHVQEFLCAVLVLLKVQPLRSSKLLEAAALQDLHYSMLQAMLLHETREQEAAIGALQGMPGEQQQSPALLAAMGLPPGGLLTAEQVKILNNAIPPPGAQGGVVIVNAFAGSAKSTTLKMLMHARPELRILMTAYNKNTVEEGKRHAPHNVDCRTTHSLAGSKLQELSGRQNWKLDTGNLNFQAIWDHLKALPFFRARVAAGGAGSSWAHAFAVKEALEIFVTSADGAVGPQHVPQLVQRAQ